MTVQIETHRLEEERVQKAHDRWKDRITSLLVIGAMSGSLLLAVGLIVFSNNPENRRLGESIVLLVLGALGGYITGSKLK